MVSTVELPVALVEEVERVAFGSAADWASLEYFGGASNGCRDGGRSVQQSRQVLVVREVAGRGEADGCCCRGDRFFAGAESQQSGAHAEVTECFLDFEQRRRDLAAVQVVNLPRERLVPGG